MISILLVCCLYSDHLYSGDLYPGHLCTHIETREPDDSLAISEDTVESTRLEVQAAIRSGNWRLAKKRLAIFTRIGKKEFRKESQQLRSWLKARQALTKIQAKQKKKPLSARQYLSQLERVKKKHQKAKLFAKEMASLIKKVSGQAFLLLDNFDRDLGNNFYGDLGTDAKKVSQPTYTGAGAVHWRDSSIYESRWALWLRERDWRNYDALVFWVHAKKPGQIFEVRVWEGKMGHIAHVKVTWTGWREVRLPLHGKKSAFRNDPGSDWDGLKSITFDKEEGLKIDLTFDEFKLERSAKKPDIKKRKK